MGKYKVILADPPWHYDNTISNGAAENHYLTMKKEEIKRLPVWSLADDDAVLLMWYTSTHVEEAVALAEAWGFDVRTMKGFTWVKFNKGAPDRFDKKLEKGEFFDWVDLLDFLNKEVKINGGNYTRANSEDVLIAVRGKGIERVSASVRQIIFSCLGDHSGKRFSTGSRSCMAMCRASSCLPATLIRAGTVGAIRHRRTAWSCARLSSWCRSTGRIRAARGTRIITCNTGREDLPRPAARSAELFTSPGLSIPAQCCWHEAPPIL